MEGNLRDTPLSSVLELINLTNQSGRLQVAAELPLALTIVQGEIIAGNILDWGGLEAIQSFKLHANEGNFRFTPATQAASNQFSIPFSTLMTDWARINDEWARMLPILGSPSRMLEYSGTVQDTPHPFQGGKSIRAVGRTLEASAFEVATRVMPLLPSKVLMILEKYAWMGMRIQHPAARKASSEGFGIQSVSMHLDGKRRIADLVDLGFTLDTLRAYLIEAVRTGEIEVSGAGWLLRDLIWERDTRLNASNATLI
jgi:Domain of unknown function (DUF4388)